MVAMKGTIVLSAFISLAVLLLIGCSKGPSAEQLFNEAKTLQEEAKYAEAVVKYERLVQLHPKDKLAPQSQFMIGFICANELKELEKAEKAYNAFLEKYSDQCDSGMVASAQWELKNLGKDINEIEDLSILTTAERDSVNAQPEEEK